MSKRLFIFGAFLVTLAVLFGGCEKLRERLPEGMGPGGPGAPGTEAEQAEEEETVFAVNTTTAVEGEIIDYIELTGEVITRATVDIYADTVGKLSKLTIDVGSWVEKDQVIGEVDPSKPGMKFVPSPVKSPISGTVIEVPVEIGSTITQSVPVARVSRTTEKQVRTFVPEKYISKMEYGLNAVLRFAAYPEQQFSARLAEMSPVVDPQSRTMEIKLNFTQRYPGIKPGMFTELKIITEEKEGIVKVPIDCLVKRYGEYAVFVVTEEGRVERRSVRPGIQIDNKVEVVEGLTSGEKVVIRGQTLLEDGAKVRVIDEVEPLAAEDTVR
jgi:membrane fusion protein, multidrug efflux system